MDIKAVKALAEILQKTGLSVLEVEEGECKIHLEKNMNPAGFTPISYPVSSMPAVTAPAAAPETEPVIDFNHISEIKSPMVGVFYAATSPDAEPFVKKGGRVKKGDVLCIIEAMKLMNDIVAETDGEIVDICVQNGDVVEFGQVLFKIL
jgi:acetyl-CoA carboxylase biotin carboxyl carrier protein